MCYYMRIVNIWKNYKTLMGLLLKLKKFVAGCGVCLEEKSLSEH